MTGNQFKKLLGALDLTQEEAAEVIGLKRRNTIGDWCKLAQIDVENVENIRAKLSHLPNFNALYSAIVEGKTSGGDVGKSVPLNKSEADEVVLALSKVIRKIYETDNVKSDVTEVREGLLKQRDKTAEQVDGIWAHIEKMEKEIKELKAKTPSEKQPRKASHT